MDSQGDTKLSIPRIKVLNKFIESLNIESKYISKISKNDQNELSVINEALTHTSANMRINYEKLEFLGDAVLRLIASQFIEKKFPNLKVGERSELRSHLVSDKWLCKVGKRIKIIEILLMGPKTLKDNCALTTLEADSTEALIGAFYICFKKLEPIENWLSTFWEEESKIILSDPHKKNYKSALQEWCQGKGLLIPEYKIIESSKEHGNSKRFFCTAFVNNKKTGEGWGNSRKNAEKEAAKTALEKIEQQKKQNKFH